MTWIIDQDPEKSLLGQQSLHLARIESTLKTVEIPIDGVTAIALEEHWYLDINITDS